MGIRRPLRGRLNPHPERSQNDAPHYSCVGGLRRERLWRLFIALGDIEASIAGRPCWRMALLPLRAGEPEGCFEAVARVRFHANCASRR